VSVAVRRALLVVAVALATATPLIAQNPPSSPPVQSGTPAERLRAQKEELDRIRNERNDLQRRMRELQTSAHNYAEERNNLERQADATARAVRSLEQQLISMGEEEHDVTSDLVRTQDELVSKRATLHHRVREIYKRGALYSVEALLSAQSFGELVARYKYLHLVAQRDRTLMLRVETLGMLIGRQRETLVRLRGDVESSRQEKEDEEKRLRGLEEARARSLAQAQAQQKKVEQRLQQLARDEARLNGIIAALETERKRAEARAGGAGPTTSTIKTSDLGKLDWPVDGDIIYRFGRFVNTTGSTLRWNGIGIAAPEGTSVRAVSAGTVVEVLPSFGTYGPTIIVNHGGTDYSVYGSMAKISVAKGQKITKGQIIGTVGRADPELQAHLHFEIRPNQRAVDPLEWLRARR
jgi:septal ring factor EnvC (AmiA/AmiB activator)